jgi:hypothetical protein
MYVNGNIISFETIPGMGEIKEEGGEGEFKYDVVDVLYEHL